MFLLIDISNHDAASIGDHHKNDSFFPKIVLNLENSILLKVYVIEPFVQREFGRFDRKFVVRLLKIHKKSIQNRSS